MSQVWVGMRVRGPIQTILGKINVIMTPGGKGSRTMTLLRSALFSQLT